MAIQELSAEEASAISGGAGLLQGVLEIPLVEGLLNTVGAVTRPLLASVNGLLTKVVVGVTGLLHL